MKGIIQKYSQYFESKSIRLIEKCFVFSIIMCLVSLLLLSYYNIYYISYIIFDASIIIFRTGLMVGLFPIAFALVIGKWKLEH